MYKYSNYSYNNKESLFMYIRLVKSLFIFVVLLMLLSSTLVKADSRNASEDEIKLAQTINHFFYDWLAKRDVKATMGYVSSKATLSKKYFPEEFKSDNDFTKEKIFQLFQQFFTNMLNAAKTGENLTELINSSYGFMAENDSVISIKHSDRQLFELFVLNIKEGKTAQDFGFIYKFDETPSFREAVGQANCYYVMTNVKLSKLASEVDSQNKFPFEMVWVKEGNDWHILTFATIEN